MCDFVFKCILMPYVQLAVILLCRIVTKDLNNAAVNSATLKGQVIFYLFIYLSLIFNI